MEEKNKEVQSRRDFFKKAAKATLPVLGLIACFTFPAHKALAAMECNGCTGGCLGSCAGSCDGNCKGGCNYTCQGACASGCSSACGNRCK